MQNIFLILISVSAFLGLCLIILAFYTIHNTKKTLQALREQRNALIKIQTALKHKMSINETTEKAEIVYQGLLEDLIPIMAAIDIMPRNTTEHPLWRAIGGIMDEKDKNPFVLEKLRRAIKLDPNIAHNVNHYLNRANVFLQHISSTDSDGILATTFTDGLLGQSLTFFAQAQSLANADK